MQTFVRVATLAAAIGTAAPAAAQTPTEPPRETRPATTTASGDTGLWFVPTGEILPAKKWSFSAYRVNFDYEQGFTDVSNFPVTFGVGLADRAEIFGAFNVVNRIDRDVRPLFFPSAADTVTGGGIVNEYPFVSREWSGNQLGDLWLGAKVNVSSQYRQQPAAFAIRGLLKIPTADKDEGGGTGKTDFAVDGILSREFNDRVELSGYAGFIVRGDPDEVDLLNGIRWGVGVATPSRSNLRLTAELHGEVFTNDTVELTGPHILPVFSAAIPSGSPQAHRLNGTVGLTWIGSNGMFAGAGINWNANLDGRSEFGAYEDETGDSLGFQFRIGYHPGVRYYIPPPPPLPPPPPAKPAEHVLSVKAQCNPCTVEVGQISTVTALPQSSIGCSVTYNWTAPAGTFTNRTGRETPWTAPNQEGTVPVTVTVTCPQDGKTASATVNIQVVRPAIKSIVIEDVHFDFDRYSLRPEATRALDEAVTALQQAPDARIEIEGHTCNIGTAEYNLALGERRANAVRDYLTSRGVGADRLRTVSYGEERPKHDNAREETRRLNRRAALIVRVSR
jgi:outer membrane protein OmpA-like peptidoglycan-associated protein